MLQAIFSLKIFGELQKVPGQHYLRFLLKQSRTWSQWPGWLIIAALCSRRDIITGFFSQSFDPVVKGARIDVMLCTPLVITKTAAAAFHDELVLFICCASLCFHTGNLHNYSEMLAFHSI